MGEQRGAAGLLAAIRGSLAGYWVERLPWQTFAYVVGALLIASGLVHLGVFAIDGGPWAGPVSWRKAVTFGVSFGSMTVTVAWLASFVRMRRLAGWLIVGTFAAACAVEVALVTMQAWRGVPSHFNDSDQFGVVVFIAMGIAIGFAAIALLALTIRAFGRVDAPRHIVLAIRAGLLLLMIGQGLGYAIIANGLAPGMDPATASTFGAAGVMKLPHAAALHGVQILPGLAWLLGFTQVGRARRTQLIVLVCLGYVGLLGVTLLQTFSGLAPTDLLPAAAALMGLSLVVLGASLAVALHGLWDTWFAAQPSPRPAT